MNIKEIAIALIGVVMSFVCVYAQDIVVKTNGDELEAQVLEVSSTEVQFKKWSNLNGPTYRLPISDIFMIIYSNGDKDVFSNRSSLPSISPSSQMSNPSKTIANALNPSLIEKYNADFEFKPHKESDKAAGSAVGVLAIDDTSTLSSDDMQISLVQIESGPYLEVDEGTKQDVVVICFGGRYEIVLHNNLDTSIYIDKAQSYRVNPDGSCKFFCQGNNQTTISAGRGSGLGLNLGAVAGALGMGGPLGVLAGGIGVGSGSGTSVSTTYVDSRILSIPPKATVKLATDLYTPLPNKVEGVVHQKAEYFETFPAQMLKGLREGEIRYNSNNKWVTKYVIVYSTNPELKNLRQQGFGVYIKACLGFRNTYWGSITRYCGYDNKAGLQFGMKYHKFLQKYFNYIAPNIIVVIDNIIPKELRVK